jgi:glycosyltransferase involved in cell wall biosynthesis
VFNVSFPLKVLEYAACDIPIVMSKMPAHVEIAKSVPQSALYVPSIESFLQAVERATKSPAGAARKSSEAFDWRATAKTLTSFYKSLYEARKT